MARSGLRSATTVTALTFNSQPPERTRNSRRTAAKDASDDDKAVTPTTSLSKRSTSKKPSTNRPKALRRNLRSNGRSDTQVQLPERKRRAGAIEHPTKPSKRRRSNEGADHEDTGEVEEEPQDDQYESAHDDESAPTNPGFWDGIRAAVNPDAGHVKELPQFGLNDGSNEEENGVEFEKEEVELGEPRVPHSGADGGSEDDVQPQEKTIIAASTIARPEKGSRPKKKRQSQRTTFGEEGYETPRVGSPELGTVSSRSKKKTPSEKVQHQAEKANTQSNTAGEVLETREVSSDKDLEEKEAEEDGEGPENAARSDAEQPGEETSNAEVHNQSMTMVDDSIFIAPPQDTEDLLTIKLDCAHLNPLLFNMRFQGWTHEGKDWFKELLVQKDENEGAWLKRQKKFVLRSWCRDLLKCLIRLWDHCHRFPRAADPAGQFAYLHHHASALRSLFGQIRKLVDKICAKISVEVEPPVDEQARSNCHESTWAQKAVKDLYKRIIPLLILVIREAFLIGGTSHTAANDQLPSEEEYRFTSSTLDILIRAMGWTQRLFNAMKYELEAHPPLPITDSGVEEDTLRIATERRNKSERHLVNLSKSFREATDQLDQLAVAPQKKKEAEERDKAIRAERQRKERERWEDEELKMQRFIQSTQRMAQGATISHPRSSQPSSWELRSTLGEHRSDRDEYFEKHGGWYYWEDDRLLDMIRRVLRPNVSVLATLVPHRSAREVEERVKALKDRMRLKYETSNMEPPLWCYYHA